MPDSYHVVSTSNQSFEVGINEQERYIILSSGTTTRKILKAIIVDNASRPEDKVKIKLLHQRKAPSGSWEDVESINLNSLRAGEGVRLDLDSETTSNLARELTNLYQMANSGQIGSGEYDLIVGRADEIVQTDRGRAEVLKKLLELGHGEEFWQTLVAEDPDLATRLSYSKIQLDRASALQEFERNINDATKDENYWQNFFNSNQWIFGYGLRYQMLGLITDQPNYGGTRVTGSGGQRGDYLTETQAEAKFTVLVEIKKPQTLLVTDREQRNGCYELGRELIDGVNQIQVNCQTWEIDGSRTDSNRDTLGETLTCKPKGIIVIGNTSQLNNRNKKTSFQTFRNSLVNPEVITFDELLERARFIVGHIAEEEPRNEVIEEDPLNDIPF
jgi:hypothetical protein